MGKGPRPISLVTHQFQPLGAALGYEDAELKFRPLRDFSLAGTLLVGSIPGVLIGSRIAPWLPGKPLKAILAGMLVFVGVRLLLT